MTMFVIMTVRVIVMVMTAAARVMRMIVMVMPMMGIVVVVTMRMIMRMSVIMSVRRHMLRIGAALGIEGRLDLAHLGAEAARHVGDDMVAADA